MTKFELAARKHMELGVAKLLEHVSDLCEQAIASGDTSGLEELVLREPGDPMEVEAKKWASDWVGLIMTPHGPTRLERLETLVFTALCRGREIERGEGK